MKKYTINVLSCLFVLWITSTINGMDPIIQLGKQGDIEAWAVLSPHIPTQPHLTRPLCYSLTTENFDEEENDVKIIIEPYMSVRRTECFFYNKKTQEKINELAVAYYPRTFPLSLILAEHPKIQGFLQVGPVTDVDGRHLLDYCATFIKRKHFVPATEYNGQAFYDRQNYFHVPMSITFKNLNALQQQIPSFLQNPTIEPAGLCSQEDAITSAIDLRILKYSDPETNSESDAEVAFESKLQHGENGSLNIAEAIEIFMKEAEKIANFRRKVQKRGTVAAVLDGRYPKQYSSNKKRRLNTTQPNNTTTTTTTTTTKSVTE